MDQQYKPALKKLIPVVIIAVLIFCIGFSSTLVEKAYSEVLYLYIAVSLRFISSRIPFPLGDLLYLLLIAFAIYRIALLIKMAIGRKLKKTDRVLIPVLFAKFFLILYIAFKLLWGLNYSRPPINKRLGIADDKYTNKELLDLAKLLIAKINTVQVKRNVYPLLKAKTYSMLELQNIAVKSYEGLSKANSFFNYPQPVVKSVLNSWVITKIGLEGYYSPVSGEANLNTRIPAANLPFVTCHEIAHQLGIGREDEANLIGYLAATHSADLNFQYSGYYSVLKNVLLEIRIKEPEQYKLMVNSLNPGTVADFKKDRNFWMQYNSDLYLYMDAAFDQFLKLNNQNKGTDSYQDIVIWLYNIHKKELPAG
jgi:hypothetical protein